MRAFLVCSTLLLLLIGGVIGNCFFVRHHVSRIEEIVLTMTDLKSTVDPDRFSRAQAESAYLESAWKRAHKRIAISVSEEELLPIGQSVTHLQAYASVGLTEEYEACRALILQNLSRLKELEAPLWHTLL
jgi:hypothetical protein